VNCAQVSDIKQCLGDKGLPQTGSRYELAARLKAAGKYDSRANGVGGIAVSRVALDARDLAGKKRSRAESGPEEAPATKKQRTGGVFIPLDKLLELFPLHTSSVVVQCAERQAASSDSQSLFTVRAGEVFEVIVTIKTCFGLVEPALAQQMMREIFLLPEKILVRQSERFTPSTGIACFSVRIEKAGETEIAAAIMMPNIERLQHGGAAPVAHIIGGKACVTCVKVRPGAMHFQSMIAKRKGLLGSHVEFERGEQIELMLQLGPLDQFGNAFALPFSDCDAKAFVADMRLEGHMIHLGEAVSLQLMPPTCTEAGILVGMMDLRVLGTHHFRIKYCSQVLTTQVKIVPGIPHSLQLIGEGRPHVLRQWRWGCKVHLLNQHGYPDISPAIMDEISAELVPCSGAEGGNYTSSLPLEIELLERPGSIRGCPLADADTATLLQELQIVHIENDIPACKGEYHLQVKVGGQVLSRDPIHLDVPLDPSSWSPQDLADSIRLGGLEVPSDVLQDEFGAVVSGKDLVASHDRRLLLTECLLHHKTFANRQEKDDVHARLKQFADGLMEKHTLANLGKGRFKSSVAKCISESDLRCVRLAPVCMFMCLCVCVHLARVCMCTCTCICV